MKILTIIAIIIFACALSFGLTTILFYGICWAFGWCFSWKIAFGVWLVLIFINLTLKPTVKKED